MDFQKFKQAVIDAAEARGIEEYEIYYMNSSSLSAEALKDSLSGFSCGQGGGISLRCMVDGKMGYASTEHLSEEEAVSLVERALDNAKSIESEEQAFIHTKGDTYAVLEKEEVKTKGDS